MDLKKLTNYDNCITNLTSSIAKHYGLTPFYKTNEIIDKLLQEKDYENIIVFIFDGMGMSILNSNTTENSFLRKKLVSSMHSTFPPTTANCTTSFITGLNPISTGWLGWSTYFKDIDLAVDNFKNRESFSKKEIEGENVAYAKLPITHLGTLIQQHTNNEVTYHQIMPSFVKNGYKSLKEFEHRICKLCEQKGKKYIYAYYDQPDSCMHIEGTTSINVKKYLNKISKVLHNIERKTKNTIGIVSADHSLVDVVPIALYTYYDVLNCLYAPVTCDARCSFFFVKKEKEEIFKELFNKYFSEYYELFSKEEVIDNNLFGYGQENILFKDIIGDYVAIAKDKYYFLTSPNSMIFKGHHSGGLTDESNIPIIIIKN